MSTPILHADGSPTILSSDSLKLDIEFTNVDDMVKQQVETVLESRKDWTRDTQWVKDVEKRARDFYAKYQPGDRLCWFSTGGGMSMRAGLVILRNGRVEAAWILLMS